MIYAFLNKSSDYFTNDKYQDLKIRDFGELKKIRSFLLTSKELELDGMEFDADLLFDNFQNRSWLKNDKVWPIFSPNLMTLLEDFDLPYRNFPVHLYDSNNKKSQLTYKALQIPPIQNLVDFDNSIFKRKERFPHYFESVEKLVFDLPPSCPALFRCYELRTLLFVKEEIKLAIEKAKMDNFVFVPAKEYHTFKPYH